MSRIIKNSLLLRQIDSKLRSGALGTAAAKRQYSSDTERTYDVIVVGGGIVGVASALEISAQHPQFRVAVVEKENGLAYHQTGHNSGVIHAGIYYTPGSLKAKLCVEGSNLIMDYCDRRNLPYKKVGKLIVATNNNEVEGLKNLEIRGHKNNVRDLRWIGADEIKKYEPHCVGINALHSPHTAIVDFKVVTNSFADDFKKLGGEVYCNFEAKKIEESNDPEYPVRISGNKVDQKIRAKYVVTCGGLQSDKIAESTGCPKAPRIIPFRGEYLKLKKGKENLVNGNIYPVPDARFPFLGVHFTPRMDGSVWLGPNAVLAFKREGYTWLDLNIKEFLEAVTYPGFLKMASKFIGFGSKEMLKSLVTSMQVKDLQRFIPTLEVSDVTQGPAGVRAQALDMNGQLVDDFVFHLGGGDGAVAKRVLHCRNAPSPGATSSMAIGKMINEKFDKTFLSK